VSFLHVEPYICVLIIRGHVEDGGNGRCELAKVLEASFEKLFWFSS
jgi:hypothetical protein